MLRPGIPYRLFVAVNLFPPLVTLLRLYRKRGDRPGVQSLQADRLAGLLAKAVSTVVNPLHRCIDFRNQLSLAVAGPEFDGAVGFGRRTVGEIRMVGAFLGKVLKRFPRLPEDVISPGN